MGPFVAGAVIQHAAGSLMNAGTGAWLTEPLLFVILGSFLLFVAAVVRTRKPVPFRAVTNNAQVAKSPEILRVVHPAHPAHAIHCVNPATIPHAAKLTAEPVEILG
jgi:hypothetical protein